MEDEQNNNELEQLPPLESIVNNNSETNDYDISDEAINAKWKQLTDEGVEEFFLAVYVVKAPALQQLSGTLDSLFNFLEEKGQSIGEPLKFKLGTTVNFFKTILKHFNVDLMPLLGSHVELNPEEDSLCCGTLDTTVAQKAAKQLQVLIKDQSQREKFKQMANKCGFKKKEEESWALETAVQLSTLLHDAVNKIDTSSEDAIMGLFE